MTITNINGGSQIRSTKRFAGCGTLEDMKSKLVGKETIGVYAYGGGSQIEVRAINRSGRRVIVATADIVS